MLLGYMPLYRDIICISAELRIQWHVAQWFFVLVQKLEFKNLV